jgi:two-component system, chemotaxis family, response regulator Rcp1
MGFASGLTFPLVADESGFPLLPPDPSGDINSEAESRRTPTVPIVLLIEDNAADVYVTGRVLKQCGIAIELQVASDGEQALAVLRAFEKSPERRLPSLILLDWNLPRASGAEVLKYARQSEPWRDVPVVVVTSTDSPAEIREIVRLGATAHFSKPTDLDAYLDLKRIVVDMLPTPPRTSS